MESNIYQEYLIYYKESDNPRLVDENDYDKRALLIARKAGRWVVKTHPAEINELFWGKSII